MQRNLTDDDEIRSFSFGPGVWKELDALPWLQRRKLQFCDNVIVTSQYTWWNFVPKSLWGQFQRIANFFFLGVSIIMLVGTTTEMWKSPYSYETTLYPLTMVLILTMSLQLKDDLKRHRSDHETSRRPAETVLEKKQWKDIKVGELLVVRNKESLPADVIVICTSEDDGVSYVETSNIDGETNLKLRVAKKDLQKALCNESVGRRLSRSEMSKTLKIAREKAVHMTGIMDYEKPNSSVNTFKGTMRDVNIQGSKKIDVLPFTGNQQLLRGSVLRNTDWIIGLVVYTGEDTKVAQNSHESKPKLSNLERVVNGSMKVIFVILAFLVATSLSIRAIMRHNVFNGKFAGFWYLFPEGEDDDSTMTLAWPIAYAFTFLILYTNFVPLTMYITMEIINFGHSMFINNDALMYDPTTNTCANARSMNLCSELGQIQYIFSDKTGTLTQNVMMLKQVWIDGKVYGKMNSNNFDCRELQMDLKDKKKSKKIEDFMLVMSLAHTVVAERDMEQDDEEEEEKKIDDQVRKISYQAESPDEGALCDGASDVGFRFENRTTESLTISVPDGSTRTYKLRAINGFSSARKRMSVVLEMPDGTFVLLCKGADNVMLDRAAGKVMDQVEIKAQLRKFSQQGLRTLVMAKRTISKDEFETWIKGFEQASASLKNRKEMLAEAAESIEKNMEIVGASAIEDKLQDGVPDTIEDIRKAGIKLWVLTGDKVETAINIGLSCKLLLPEEKGMRTLLLDIAEEADAVDEFLERVDIDVLRRYVDEVLTKGLSCKAPTTNDLLMWRLVATSFSRMVEREKSQRNQTFKVKHMKLETIRNAMLQIRVESDLREIVQEIEIARGTISDRTDRLVPLIVKGSISKKQEESKKNESDDKTRKSSRFQMSTRQLSSLALVITGPTLNYVLGPHSDETTQLLLQITQACSVVVACRVSPLQKAQLVVMVRDGLEPEPVTLAIGDGANDVSMIKKARVGVGISGREGLQAANSADFSISQFRFLKRLLFVHGRWDYRRLSKVIIYSLHKNFVFALTLFFYNFYTIFSGTSLYDTWLGSGYNSFFLFWSPLAIGFFDKDVSEDSALKIPELYISGLLQLDLNLYKTVEMVLLSFINSIIVFFIPLVAFQTYDDGVNNGVYSLGTLVFSCLFITMEARCLFITRTYNKWVIAAIFVSLFWYFLFLTLYGGLVCLYMSAPAPYFYMVPYHTMRKVTYWVLIFTTPAISILFTLLFEYIRRELSPNFIDLCMEFSRKDFYGASVLLPSRLRRFIQRMKGKDDVASVHHRMVRDQLRQVTQPQVVTRRKSLSNNNNGNHSSSAAITTDDVDMTHNNDDDSDEDTKFDRTPQKTSTLMPYDVSTNNESVAETPGDIDSGHVVGAHLRHVTTSTSGLKIPKQMLRKNQQRSRSTSPRHLSLETEDNDSSSITVPIMDSNNKNALNPYSKRPNPNRWFMQQKLRETQFIITPNKTIAMHVVVGIIMMILGGVFWTRTDSLQEFRARYDGGNFGENSTDDSSRTFSFYASQCVEINKPIVNETTCDVSFFITKKMTAPVRLYYHLTNIYQNYNVYFESRDGFQLMGQVNDASSAACPVMTERAIGRTDTDCNVGVDETCEYLSPCGLIASSFFNDTFEVVNSLSPCDCTIAPYNEQFSSRFDCSSCTRSPASNISTRNLGWVSDRDFFKNVNDLNDSNTKYLYERFPESISQELEVTDPRFMNWMRPAAMPEFHKMYGQIEHDLEPNTEITFRITSRYPVTTFKGTKSIVLMSREGTKGHNLPLVFFVIGPYCLIVALCVALKQHTCPRVAGSANVIRDWTENAEGGRNLYLGRFEDGSEDSRKGSSASTNSTSAGGKENDDMSLKSGKYLRTYSPPGSK